MSQIAETALVFEGGGMRASATAPVVIKFIEAGLEFPHVSGISAGSSHVANYLSRDPLRARRSFVEFGADPNIGSWRTFLSGKGAFNSDYIYLHTSRPGQALPFDFETFQSTPGDFDISAFRLSDGAAVHWHRGDIKVLDDLLVRVQASSTMPGIMPFVTLDGELYADGALGPSGGIPIDAAEAAGFERAVVIMTKPRDYVRPAPSRKASALIRAAFRKYPHLITALEERAAKYNATRAHLFDLEARGRAYLYFPRHQLTSNRETNVAKLEASFAAGTAQINEDFPAILRFLGL